MYWGGGCRDFNLSVAPPRSFSMISSRHATGSIPHTVASMAPGCSHSLHLRPKGKCFAVSALLWTTQIFKLLLSTPPQEVWMPTWQPSSLPCCLRPGNISVLAALGNLSSRGSLTHALPGVLFPLTPHLTPGTERSLLGSFASGFNLI